MNRELAEILGDTEKRLEKLETTESDQYIRVKSDMINLQKQLLSASVLGKEQLVKSIKQELRLVELQFFELSSAMRELELGYLHKYIKENYE